MKGEPRVEDIIRDCSDWGAAKTAKHHRVKDQIIMLLPTKGKITLYSGMLSRQCQL
jgi:hypothetical protein